MPEAYFYWLEELIGDGFIEENYHKLLWKLYTTPFYYELLYDRNRAADGIYLRKLYRREFRIQSTNDDLCDQNIQCSVFEMMIALARKAEDDIMHDPDLGDRTSLWFWTMIENLGLDLYDDFGYSESAIDRILYTFMHHLYASNGGGGGMFLVHRGGLDMTKTDLWLQLNVYFEENFPVPIW